MHPYGHAWPQQATGLPGIASVNVDPAMMSSTPTHSQSHPHHQQPTQQQTSIFTKLPHAAQQG